MPSNTLSACICAAAVMLGCGGDDSDGGNSTAGPMQLTKSDGTCNSVAGCGGDPTGTWAVDEACFQILMQPMFDFCPGANVSLKLDDTSGMWTFKDGNFTADFTLIGRTIIHLPASCRMQQGEMLQCSDFNDTTEDGLPLTCSMTTNGDCNCSIPESSNSRGSGMYTTTGTKLDLGGETVQYCVKGDRLYIGGDMDVSMGMGGESARGALQMAMKKQTTP